MELLMNTDLLTEDFINEISNRVYLEISGEKFRRTDKNFLANINSHNSMNLKMLARDVVELLLPYIRWKNLSAPYRASNVDETVKYLSELIMPVKYDEPYRYDHQIFIEVCRNAFAQTKQTPENFIITHFTGYQFPIKKIDIEPQFVINRKISDTEYDREPQLHEDYIFLDCADNFRKYVIDRILLLYKIFIIAYFKNANMIKDIHNSFDFITDFVSHQIVRKNTIAVIKRSGLSKPKMKSNTTLNSIIDYIAIECFKTQYKLQISSSQKSLKYADNIGMKVFNSLPAILLSRYVTGGMNYKKCYNKFNSKVLSSIMPHYEKAFIFKNINDVFTINQVNTVKDNNDINTMLSIAENNPEILLKDKWYTIAKCYINSLLYGNLRSEVQYYMIEDGAIPKNLFFLNLTMATIPNTRISEKSATKLSYDSIMFKDAIKRVRHAINEMIPSKFMSPREMYELARHLVIAHEWTYCTDDEPINPDAVSYENECNRLALSGVSTVSPELPGFTLQFDPSTGARNTSIIPIIGLNDHE